ncbi:MAG: SUF system NifU family Fe-S cluster assembly protein [Woeseia sp.]|nr:SUF system NifU family Fe-S cluster assembly protein [Woeseia sp.]MBT8097232.1 SUF system NifU family Fe-S cluster assembly protein [Woeseia sp.]NNE60649.1 SUF system NifU family Fe-S cluster assembly protein [Woeseia sp.]NNL55628.1 SUF system NifU family Fe-S cluster assembly protein [Woeseia sp.]
MTDSKADTNELRDLYRELILDHARSPRHFGRPPTVTHSADGINPLCGDKLHLYLEVADGGHIDDIGFEGTGCAISMASASLMTETVAGMDSSTALGYSATLTARLTGSENAGEIPAGFSLGKLRALEGVREFPSRVKCATLPWHALRAALSADTRPASTE